MNAAILRDKVRAPYYSAIARRVGKGGEEIADALREFYQLFDTGDVIEWLAGLYDPTHGAFYYSPSARDNDFTEHKGRRIRLLPDIESTCQALVFIQNSGLARHLENDARRLLPDGVMKRIIAFTKSLQAENGYFYHPQWERGWVDTCINRRSRDLHWCSSLLRGCAVRPEYDTPDGLLGSSRRRAQRDPSQASPVPRHLSGKEEFIRYLRGMDMERHSYHLGSEIATQTDIILERDRELMLSGAGYSLMDILCDWMCEIIHPETGHFQRYSNYYGVNGFLKAGSMFNDARRPMPYPDAAADSCFEAIMSNERPEYITDVYNGWYALTFILENQKLYAGERGVFIYKKLTEKAYEKAPEMIRKTMEKVRLFEKEDGSFSYLTNMSSPTSMDMPVAVFGTNEGDVNSTGISINGIIRKILATLGLDDLTPPVFMREDAQRFKALITKQINTANQPFETR